MITLDDAAKMTYDAYKLQVAKLQYEYLDAHEKLKPAKEKESDLLESFLEELPEDFEELYEHSASMEEEDLREELRKSVKNTLSLMDKCISTKSEETQLRATYNAYNQMRLLDIMSELSGITDEDEKEKLMDELMDRIGIFVEERRIIIE